ncbi:roadblock/LC7 domain-containing protein [Kluyvera sp. 142486]|uniref:roadblock/LC7 domain-containing protein n=1 Tax=Kluyvera sp. 142486 TaxID=3390050 RepID=UPI00398101C5
MDKVLLEQAIETLSSNIPDGNCVLVSSKDGDLIAYTGYSHDVGLNRISVQISTVLGVATSIGAVLKLGVSDELSFSGPKGRVLVYRLTESYSLAVITTHDCNIAMINLMASRCIGEINQQEMLA